MAQRSKLLAPSLAAALVLALTLGTLGAVFVRALSQSGGIASLGASDLSAVRFTVFQAALSAIVSVALAIPLARALSRRRFKGRGLLITLLGAPFILPVLVAVLGLLAVFGRAGLVNQGFAAIGLTKVSIYGLQGVVLAHVFFNLPLATRLILHGWQAIPAERFQLAASLSMGPGDVVRFLERPMLRSVLPGAFLAIFLICLTSFAVALTLGGGPRATTVELAIYQAFRFDFDLGRAAVLASIQFMLCLAAGLVAINLTQKEAFGAGLDRNITLWHARSRWLRAQDVAVITGAALFLLVPLGTIIVKGLPQIVDLPLPVWHAAARSLMVSLAAVALMLALAVPLAIAAARQDRGGFWEVVAMLPLAASPLVIGTGLFLLVRPFASPGDLALAVTIVANAAMALPFAFRTILPAARKVRTDYGRLSQSLGLTGWARLRLVTLPRLQRPLRFAAGLTAALSMGDLGVVALFADNNSTTLPLQVFRLMGSYRMGDAAGAAVVLMALSITLFWLFDRGGRDAGA